MAQLLEFADYNYHHTPPCHTIINLPNFLYTHTSTRHARLTLDTHPIITFFSHMERLNELDRLHQYKNCHWDDSERRANIFMNDKAGDV